MELNINSTATKEKLLNTRKRLTEQIQEENRRINAPTIANPDNADRAFDYTVRSRQTALLEKLENHLDEVNKALQRLEDGSYGICTQCGQAIRPDRLEILPYVELCIDCQRKENARI